MVQVFDYATIAFAIPAYLIIIYGLLFKNQTGNFITWFLWTVLDVIALYGIYQKGETSTLLFVFIGGSSLVTLLLLIKKQFTWTNVEKITCIIVVICLIVSKIGNPSVVIWSGSIAVFVSGIPYLGYLKNTTEINIRTKAVGVLFFLTTIFSTFHAFMFNQDKIFSIFCLVFWFIASFLGFKSLYTKSY